ncbi:hypothetical protein [Halocynthiibacter sp.]|uniref:hypothetical protein n=1 Tax=Halocynthiibacter sp. TaxID=1979210 RepID=UPI003C6383D9
MSGANPTEWAFAHLIGYKRNPPTWDDDREYIVEGSLPKAVFLMLDGSQQLKQQTGEDFGFSHAFWYEYLMENDDFVWKVFPWEPDKPKTQIDVLVRDLIGSDRLNKLERYAEIVWKCMEKRGLSKAFEEKYLPKPLRKLDPEFLRSWMAGKSET